MANTFTILAQNILAGNAQQVIFSGISQSYSDLLLLVNAQSGIAANDDGMSIEFNSSGANQYRIGLQTTSTITYISNASALWSVCAGSNTTEQFGASELWISRYSSSTLAKRNGLQAAANGFASPLMRNFATSWNNTAAVTSLTISTASGNPFRAKSSFWLYGIADV